MMILFILEAALRALVVAAAVWAGLRVMRVGNVIAQKAAWSLVLAAAILMPLLLPLALRLNWLPAATFVLPQPQWRSARHAASMTVQQSAAPGYAPFDPAPAGVPNGQEATRPPESHPFASLSALSGNSASRSTIQTPPPVARNVATETGSLLPPPAALAGLLYLAVCAALILRLFYGLVSAVILWREAEPVPLHFAADVSLPLRSSRAVSSPVTIGCGVLLPDCYDEWDPEKLRIVLAHERSHIRQGDFYLQLLAGFYAAVFWFSPLGWWLKRKLSDLGEAISDRAGLEYAESRSSYAQILLEFAAQPHPTLIGVAMARTSSLSHRIERLLNEASFRQAFAGGRRRALLAVLMVPAALFAATVLIRVQSAEAASPAALVAEPPVHLEAIDAGQPAHDLAQTSGQSNPDSAPAAPPSPASPMAPARAQDVAPVATPAAPSSPVDAPVAPAPQADAVPAPPAPPEPSEDEENDSVTVGRGKSMTITSRNENRIRASRDAGSGRGSGYRYSYSDDGDSWAMINGPGEHVRFSGDWNDGRPEELKKAEKLAHGKFLWFEHKGKSYFIDDPGILAGIDAMYKPMEELGRQQEELGRQQEKLGKEQERLGNLQAQASVPAPDISKEMAELNAAIAKLQAKKGATVTQDDLGDIQGKIGDLQGKLGDLEGKIGERQGEFGEQQGRLGAEQGKLGEQQGRLGAEQGRIAADADRKIKVIIDDSLRNGKARPVD
jgi:beta-lactamase regulating signal transducer with metallopeptidase domain